MSDAGQLTATRVLSLLAQALAACGFLGFLGDAPLPWQGAEALAFLLPAGLVAWDVQAAQSKVCTSGLSSAALVINMHSSGLSSAALVISMHSSGMSSEQP
jgi:hypothetical protein